MSVTKEMLGDVSIRTGDPDAEGGGAGLLHFLTSTYAAA